MHLSEELQSAHGWQCDNALLEAIARLDFLQKEHLLAMAGRRHSPALSLCTPKGQKLVTSSVGPSVTQQDKKPVSCHTRIGGGSCLQADL